ncbi:MAG: hypothetical protein ABW092_07545 [Candidatus Thiodiazotropha sp.]
MKQHLIVGLLVLTGCIGQPDGSTKDEFRNIFVFTKVNHHAKDSNDLYKKIKTSFSEEEISKITYVLKYYKEEYRVDKGKIYISDNLANDLDLMANYSKKAFDEEWLKSRK